MITLNIHEAKTHLSKYLKMIKEGQEIIICKHNIPIAKLVPIVQSDQYNQRPIGLAKGDFNIPEDFYDTLPDEVVNGFYDKT